MFSIDSTAVVHVAGVSSDGRINIPQDEYIGISGDSQSTPTLSFIPKPPRSISQDLSNTIFSSFGTPPAGAKYLLGDTYVSQFNYRKHYSRYFYKILYIGRQQNINHCNKINLIILQF